MVRNRKRVVLSSVAFRLRFITFSMLPPVTLTTLLLTAPVQAQAGPLAGDRAVRIGR